MLTRSDQFIWLTIAIGSRFRVSATKEVVLSAGAIGTPHILMLSGIGPKEVLTHLGITTLVDLPSVGQNLTDHPLIQTHFLVNSTKTFDDVLRNETLAQQAFAQWNTTRQGLFAGPSGGTIGFLRLPSDSPLLSRFGDPASGPHSPHIELIFAVSRCCLSFFFFFHICLCSLFTLIRTRLEPSESQFQPPEIS